MEFFRKDLDELAEVHAAIGDVVEYGLGPVALELDVTYLHFQAQFGGYLAGAYHNLVLPGYGFLPFLYVEELGLAVDAAYVRTVGLHPLAFHLVAHSRSFEGDYAQVVAGGRLHYHHIPGLYGLAGVVPVYPFAGVLEAHLEEVLVLLLGHTLEPVIDLELAAALTVGADGFALLVVLDYVSPRAVVLPGFVILFHLLSICLKRVCPQGHRTESSDLRFFPASPPSCPGVPGSGGRSCAGSGMPD